MYTLATIRNQAIYLKKDLSPAFINHIARQTWEKLWSAHTWSWRLRRGQVSSGVPYSTGGILTLTQATSAVTGTGTTWTGAHVGDHLRPTNNSSSGDVRDYLITAVSSGTALTIADPYEGSSISSSTAYTIRRRWYRLPPDFDCIHAMKESTGPVIVDLMTRRMFEELMPSANQTGTMYRAVQAGASTFTLYNTGTLTLTKDSTTVTGSGTSFLEARDKGRRLRIRAYGDRVGDFTITAVNSTTEIIIDRAWKEETKSGQTYDIDPEGERLVELWPSPDANCSLDLWYYRVLPPIVRDDEYPIGMPREYGNVWLIGTLEALGIPTSESFEIAMERLMVADGLVRDTVVKARRYGDERQPLGSMLPGNYPYARARSRRTY